MVVDGRSGEGVRVYIWERDGVCGYGTSAGGEEGREKEKKKKIQLTQKRVRKYHVPENISYPEPCMYHTH